jgi:hypothetical protein
MEKNIEKMKRYSIQDVVFVGITDLFIEYLRVSVSPAVVGD